jgi:mRNA interferase RelE/StbE
MAQIRFTRRALRDIRKMTPETRRRLEVALDQLIDNPTTGDPLHGEWRGYWKLRMGDHRVIYSIIDMDVVEIHYVRHRRKAYRR